MLELLHPASTASSYARKPQSSKFHELTDGNEQHQTSKGADDERKLDVDMNTAVPSEMWPRAHPKPVRYQHKQQHLNSSFTVGAQDFRN
jgi:hypothetical protein